MAIRHVNLLDLEPSGPGQTELNYLAIVIVMSVIILGCAGFVVWKKYKFDALKIQVDALTEEVNKLSAASSSKNKKAAGKDIISKLNNPVSWSRLFKQVTNLVPTSMQLSQLTGSLTNARNLTLIGNHQIQQDVFKLKDLLENVPDFDKITLTSLTLKTFTLECHIR